MAIQGTSTNFTTQIFKLTDSSKSGLIDWAQNLAQNNSDMQILYNSLLNDNDVTLDTIYNYINQSLVTVKHTLTFSSDFPNGIISVNPPQPDYGYDQGQEVQITAIPNENFVFGEWTGDVDQTSISNPLITITMDSDKTIGEPGRGSFINIDELRITESEVRERVADEFYKLWFTSNELTDEQVLSLQTTINEEGKQVTGRTEGDQLVFFKKDRNTLENRKDFQGIAFENIVQNVYINDLLNPLNSDNFESLFSFEVDDPVTENDISIINYKVKYQFGQNIYIVNVAKWDDTNSKFIDVLNLSQITKPKSNTEKINPIKAREILDTDIFELLPSQRTRQDDIDDFFQTFNTLAGSPPIFSDADGDGAAEYISPQESIRDYNSRISAADTPTAKITRLNSQANPINEEKTLERLRNRLNLYLKDVDNNVSIIPDQRPEYENKSSGFLKIRKPNQAIVLRSPAGGLLEFDGEGENSYRNGFTITMWVRFIGKSGRGTLFNYGNPTNEEKFGFRLETLTKEHEGEYYRIVRLLVGDTDILSPHSDLSLIHI